MHNPYKTFLQQLADEVDAFCAKWKLTEGQALGMWVSINYLEMDDSEAYEAVSFDGGNDKDIDVFRVDDSVEKIVIGQTKFSRKGTYKGAKNDLLGLIHTTDWLKDEEALLREGRRDFADAAADYARAVDAGYSIEYLYVYSGPTAETVQDTARQFNVSEAGELPSRSCQIVSLDDLVAINTERTELRTRIAKCTLAVPRQSRFRESGGYGEALVASIPGSELKRLYEEHGDRLFDRNVRLFLGARKGGVNAGIRDTIADKCERPKFWAYNNGITFICDTVKPWGDTVKLTNFSVVNGCQSTVSIANSTVSEAKEINILARFIAAPEPVIDSIITYNNSQNPIRVWDLNAQNKLQKRIKRDFASQSPPYLYVLRKGETRQLSPVDRKKFTRDGRLQSIPHDLCGQYIAAFRGLPAIGYKDKGQVFTAYRDRVYPSQIKIEEMILIWHAGNVCHELVKSELATAAQSNDSDRVAILKRGGTFFVLATLSTILHSRNGNVFLNNLKYETASSKATIVRLRKYATISLEWYVRAMKELVNIGQDVATIVRTQEGWEGLRLRIESEWKVYSQSKKTMEEALPRL